MVMFHHWYLFLNLYSTFCDLHTTVWVFHAKYTMLCCKKETNNYLTRL